MLEKTELSDASRLLEGEAVVLIRQYGFFLPAPARNFFAKLAMFLNWQQLQEALK